MVSTHSRPKAAGPCTLPSTAHTARFNTQPPEGGWFCARLRISSKLRFQHTAARRRLANAKTSFKQTQMFQHTAARRRLALWRFWHTRQCEFQHTAARRRLGGANRLRACLHRVSTHSRPKAAGMIYQVGCDISKVSTHSRPKAAGTTKHRWTTNTLFQHTAARRRLAAALGDTLKDMKVSTHSRPKAAGTLSCTLRNK